MLGEVCKEDCQPLDEVMSVMMMDGTIGVGPEAGASSDDLESASFTARRNGALRWPRTH